MNKTDKKKDKPFVFVRCLTYNHEKYIEDALKGFVMQKTDFPFVVVIVNDASPDNTKFIIQQFISAVCKSENVKKSETEYADIIQATPTDNPNCLLYVLNLYENHFQKKSQRQYYQAFVDKATYWAECEGDDYWTDSCKLQKQVDFMEMHPDYSICFHRVKYLMNDTGEMVDEYIVKDMPGESSIVDLAQGNYIHYPSVMLRNNKDVWMKIATIGSCMPTDYVWLMMFAETGKIWKFEEPMSVYRVGSGIWSTANSIKNDLLYLCSLSKLYVAIDNPEVRANLQKQIDGIIESVVHINKDLCRIQQSKAYRLGKLLLKPFRWMRRE